MAEKPHGEQALWPLIIAGVIVAAMLWAMARP